jgi:hypothetical protein
VFNLHYLPETAIKKIYLQMKCPPGHVVVKIFQVRVVLHGFFEQLPFKVVRQFLRQGSFAGSNVPDDGYVHAMSYRLQVVKVDEVFWIWMLMDGLI